MAHVLGFEVEIRPFGSPTREISWDPCGGSQGFHVGDTPPWLVIILTSEALDFIEPTGFQ